MAPTLRAHLQQAAESRQGPTPLLVSGAGHDAAIMAHLGPTGMLFVRCRDGLSHHPDEWASPEDIEMGVAVLVDAIVALGNAHQNRYFA
jgi:allantoate deiminase